MSEAPFSIQYAHKFHFSFSHFRKRLYAVKYKTYISILILRNCELGFYMISPLTLLGLHDHIYGG